MYRLCNQKLHCSKMNASSENTSRMRIKRPVTFPKDKEEKDMSDEKEMNGTVFNLCRIPSSLHIEKLKTYIHNYMEPRKEYYEIKNRPPFIEDEMSEFYTAQASAGREIGAGNCGMDVKTTENEGIDTMCVIMNKHHSNEKSIIQNFSSSGNNLDSLFKEGMDEEAVRLYVNDYSRKLEVTKCKQQLTDMYLLSFISTSREVYVVCFKIDLEYMKHVRSDGFVNHKKNGSTVNINVSNMIHPSYGNVKLYKSKKRMELRLYPTVIESEYAIKLYSMDA